MLQQTRLGKLISQSSNLKQAVGILFVTVLVSNVLGLLRNVIIANRVGVTFGTIGPLDNYYAAFILPDLLYNIVIVGALSSAILPLLTRIDSEGREDYFWKTFNTLLSIGLIVISLCLVALFFLLPVIMNRLLPGFTQTNLATTITLARIMIVSPLFFTISQITTSALQAKRVFLSAAIAPIIYNIAIISCALLIPQRGLSILAIGVIVGAISHFLVQLPSLVNLGWKWEFINSWQGSEIKEVVRLMIPRAIALTGNQLLLIAFYRIASNLQAGSIAIYSLTDTLQTAPVLLLANTLAMAVLPDFVRHIAKNSHQEFEQLVGKSIRLILFMFLPTSIFLIIFRQPIVDLYISIGHSISRQEVEITATTLAFFVWSFFFQGAILILARAYFAQHNTAKPTLFSLISIAFSWIVALLLTRFTELGVAGLALAFSLGSTVNACLLWFSHKLPMRILWKDSQNKSNFLPLVGGAVLCGVVFLIMRRASSVLISMFIVSQSGANLVEIVLGFAAGIAVYVAWSSAFNIEQWNLIKPSRKSSTLI